MNTIEVAGAPALYRRCLGCQSPGLVSSWSGYCADCTRLRQRIIRRAERQERMAYARAVAEGICTVLGVLGGLGLVYEAARVLGVL